MGPNHDGVMPNPGAGPNPGHASHLGYCDQIFPNSQGPVQRSISFQQSFILLCLGLAFWLSAQDWLLPRMGLKPPESIRPSELAPIRGAVAAPNSSPGNSSETQLQRLRHNPFLKAIQQGSSLGSVIGPMAVLFSDAQPIAMAPQAQGDTGRVVIDLSDRLVYLYPSRDSKIAIAQYDVAIGQDGWETPPGRYLIDGMQTEPAWQHPITHEVVPPGKDNPLGAAWISFLTTEDYSLGLHGTNDESLVGQAVSHGCVRMRNDDVIALYEKVSLGWPLDVQP